jgi:hypothetical protein
MADGTAKAVQFHRSCQQLRKRSHLSQISLTKKEFDMEGKLYPLRLQGIHGC